MNQPNEMTMRCGGVHNYRVGDLMQTGGYLGKPKKLWRVVEVLPEDERGVGTVRAIAASRWECLRAAVRDRMRAAQFRLTGR